MTRETLFQRLTPENQAKVTGFMNQDLTTALHENRYFSQLNARDLYMLADLFNLNNHETSFASAMLQISNLFNPLDEV